MSISGLVVAAMLVEEADAPLDEAVGEPLELAMPVADAAVDRELVPDEVWLPESPEQEDELSASTSVAVVHLNVLVATHES